MKKILTILSVFMLIALNTVFAEDRAETKVLSAKNLDLVNGLYRDANVQADLNTANNTAELQDPIEFKFRVNGIGRFKTSFNKQKFFKFQDKNQALLQGEVTTLSGTKGISKVSTASIIKSSDGKYFLTVQTQSNSRRAKGWKGVLTIHLELVLDGNKYVVINKSIDRSSRQSADKLNCITNHKLIDSTDADTSIPSIKATVRIATVLLEADAEYAQVLSTERLQKGEVRGSISTTSALIMNQVDAVYQNDLGVSLVATLPTGATNYTSPVGLDDDYDVYALAEMAAVHPPSSRVEDVHFLLTGKESDSSLPNLAGIARDIGAVCKRPENSIALTIRFDNNEDFLTTAHEIGHLFGGEHDDDFTTASKPGIMNAGTNEISGEITNFSTYSKNQIATYVNKNSSCMTSGEGNNGGGGGGENGGGEFETLPANSAFGAFKEGRYFYAELYNEEDESGYEGYAVSVLYKKTSKEAYATLKTLTTDFDGYARFKPKKTGIYAFQVENLISRKLKYKKK